MAAWSVATTIVELLLRPAAMGTLPHKARFSPRIFTS